MTKQEFEQIEQDNPILGEVVAVLEEISDVEKNINSIKTRVDTWLWLDGQETADLKEFDEAIKWLRTNKFVVIDDNLMVTVTDKGTELLNNLFKDEDMKPPKLSPDEIRRKAELRDDLDFYRLVGQIECFIEAAKDRFIAAETSQDRRNVSDALRQSLTFTCKLM